MSISTIIAFVFLALAIITVLTSLLVPLPFLTWKQGKEETMSGQVTAIRKEWLGAYKVSITQGLGIDQSCLQGGITSMSGSVTMFVVFRFWQPLPTIGEIVEVTYQNRNYRLRTYSYNWVRVWKQTDQIGLGATIQTA